MVVWATWPMCMLCGGHFTDLMMHLTAAANGVMGISTFTSFETCWQSKEGCSGQHVLTRF